jgi:hypothetical protein
MVPFQSGTNYFKFKVPLMKLLKVNLETICMHFVVAVLLAALGKKERKLSVVSFVFMNDSIFNI